MPARSALKSRLEEQLLVQLGTRLRQARKEQGLSAAELASQVGISRTTLAAVEKGDPSPTFGTYARVLTALGFIADLALVATGSAGTVPATKRSSRSTASGHHRPQDRQSLMMHREAVALLKADPSLVARLQATLARWLERDDAPSRPLLERWAQIIESRDWDAALARTELGQQLRQASPLPTLLPDATRLSIIREVRALEERQRAQA